MESSLNLKLPLIQPGQAQKHVTHNEAIEALDRLMQIAIRSSRSLEPPLFPDQGERYLVPVPAGDGWSAIDGSDHAGDLAVWQDESWHFHTPRAGWLVWVMDQRALRVYDGTNWLSIADNPQ